MPGGGTIAGGYEGAIVGGGFGAATGAVIGHGIEELYGMCKRAFGGGGGGGENCDERLAAEQRRCSDRKWQMAHPDYFRGCMDRAMERYLKCKKGDHNEPDEWGDGDEETGLDHSR